MEYTIRNKVLPSYYQIGYKSILNGVSIDETVVLPSQAISALHYHRCHEFGICCSGKGETHIENRIYRFTPGDIQYVGANAYPLLEFNKN
jgi:quercetin dioxygenase-like cupin family protein